MTKEEMGLTEEQQVNLEKSVAELYNYYQVYMHVQDTEILADYIDRIFVLEKEVLTLLKKKYKSKIHPWSLKGWEEYK